MQKKAVSGYDIDRADLVHQALDAFQESSALEVYQLTIRAGDAPLIFTQKEVQQWPKLKAHLIDGIRGAFTNVLIIGDAGLDGYGSFIGEICDSTAGQELKLPDFFARGMFMTRKNRAFLEAEDRSLGSGDHPDALQHVAQRALRSAHYYRIAAEALWQQLDEIDSLSDSMQPGQQYAVRRVVTRRYELMRRDGDKLTLIE